MSMSIRLSAFSIERWAELLEAAKEKGSYLYQTCKYEGGSLVLSYEVMTAANYEIALRQMSQKIECIEELALSALQACKRETKKLSLSDISWITERYLNEQSLKKNIKDIKEDWGKDLCVKVIDEEKDAGTALGEILGFSHLLSQSATQFYDQRVAPHRTGFCGRLREIISLIQDVFHKYSHVSFVKIFEAKGLETRFKGMTQCVEDAKRGLAETYLNAMNEHVIAHAPNLLPDAHTPPPRGRKAAATPILERAAKTPKGGEAQKAQHLRNKLKEYLGIKTKDQIVEEPVSEEDSL